MHNSYFFFCFFCAHTLFLLCNNNHRYCYKPYSYQKQFFDYNFLLKTNNKINDQFLSRFELNQSKIRFLKCYECNRHFEIDLPFMLLNLAAKCETNNLNDKFIESSKFSKKLSFEKTENFLNDKLNKDNLLFLDNQKELKVQNFSNIINFCDNFFQMQLKAPVSSVNKNFDSNVEIKLPIKNITKRALSLYQLPVWFYRVLFSQRMSNTIKSETVHSFNFSSTLIKNNYKTEKALLIPQPVLKRKKLKRIAKNFDPLSDFNWLNLSPRITSIKNVKTENF